MKDLKEQWIVEGVMPERAIDRLQRAGITVFRAKKIKKMQILFHISKKDIEKAFAIYPNMCYNSIRGSVRSVYTFTRVGAPDARARSLRAHKALGVLLGVCCWLVTVFASASLVLRIEVVGSKIYEREARAVLREHGVTVFSIYPEQKENEISARILALDGVEFCSVQKRGNTVTVEVRMSTLPQGGREDGDLVSPKAGVLQSAVALGGTLLKKAGDEVREGETIVGGYFTVGEDGERKSTDVVAKAKLLCEETLEAESEEAAVSAAVLLVENLGGELVETLAAQTERGAVATVRFFLTVKKNM